MMLLMIFVVVPLLGFTALIVFIYRRVANNRTSYYGIIIVRFAAVA